MSDLAIYHIRIHGHLPDTWSEWLGGMNVEQTSNGETCLSGPLADQAALHGILRRLCDLNLTLIALERREYRAGRDAGVCQQDI